MRKLILGSGIIGLLARELLGKDWEVVPFNRSRFYSFRPALDDNFIIRDERIDDFVEHLKGKVGFIYKILYSYDGNLFDHNEELSSSWLTKVFGSDIPPQSDAYLSNRRSFFVYDIKINQLYEELQNKHQAYLVEESKKGIVTEIGDRYLIRSGERIEFDAAISTIPLDILCSLSRKNSYDLPAQQVWYFHIETDELDFEGANQLLVVDPVFDFFKVANIARRRYLFYCKSEIPTPGAYFLQIMQKFDMIDGTTIDKAIPTGPIPDLQAFERMGIYCVGSNAQWDWCMDVGSCIIRLLKLKPSLV